MKQQIATYSLILATVFTFQACSSDDDNSADTTKPTIVLNTPTEDQHFHPGETIELNANFTDNLALGSYKIEVHHAGDGHTHKNANSAEWYYIHTSTIDGNPKTYQATHTIEIPTLIEGDSIELGHYHLGIYLIDAAGNEQQQFIEIGID